MNYDRRMRNILICDDEIEIVEGLLILLRDPAVRLLPCLSGNEAIAILKKEKVDVVVCDFMMPDGNGEDVLRYLQKREESFPDAFIFFSAHFNLLGFSAPSVTVIPKPEIMNLVAAVREKLRNLEERNDEV